jgi:hypothetical protein
MNAPLKIPPPVDALPRDSHWQSGAKTALDDDLACSALAQQVLPLGRYRLAVPRR